MRIARGDVLVRVAAKMRSGRPATARRGDTSNPSLGSSFSPLRQVPAWEGPGGGGASGAVIGVFVCGACAGGTGGVGASLEARVEGPASGGERRHAVTSTKTTTSKRSRL